MRERIRFYVVGKKADLPASAKFPCVRLQKDDWDDFGYKTLFRLTYYETPTRISVIGEVKILSKSDTGTKLDREFTKLDPSYCSLFQSITEYKRLKKLVGLAVYDVLESLRDAACLPGVRQEFEDLDGFQKSLLRDRTAVDALENGSEQVVGKEADPRIFEFSTRLPGAEGNHTIGIDFEPRDKLPNRIIAFIGMNGTGKTQVLARIARALAGFDDSGKWGLRIPSFDHVFAVSYSAFDRFPKSKVIPQVGYKYFGVVQDDEVRLIDTVEMRQKITEAVDSIGTRKRHSVWFDFASLFFPPEFLTKISDDKTPSRLDELSSGQYYLLLVISQLVASIRDNSLLLQDEPELHLHPNAIAKYVRELHKLLEIYDSCAILATHSPIVLQEIPSHWVRVFRRHGVIPSVDRLEFECFGENLTEITDNVFDAIEVKRTYKEILEQLAKEYSTDEILEIFKNKLGFNATTYLRTVSRNKKRNRE